jgi:hypothetical protein
MGVGRQKAMSTVGRHRDSVNETLEQKMPSVQKVEHQRIIEYLTRRFNRGSYQIDRTN